MSETLSPATSRMRLTAELGAQFWNDSCAPNELAEAVERGAVGATSSGCSSRTQTCPCWTTTVMAPDQSSGSSSTGTKRGGVT